MIRMLFISISDSNNHFSQSNESEARKWNLILKDEENKEWFEEVEESLSERTRKKNDSSYIPISLPNFGSTEGTDSETETWSINSWNLFEFIADILQ